MGSLKSKLFTNDPSLPNGEANVKKLSMSKEGLNNTTTANNTATNRPINRVTNRNPQYRTNRSNKTVKSGIHSNGIPKSQYFRSLRTNTKKQFSNLNKNINNASGLKLFGAVRSKSHSEVNRQSFNKTELSDEKPNETKFQEETANDEAVGTEFITNQLKTTSIKSSENTIIDEKKEDNGKIVQADGEKINNKMQEAKIEIDNNATSSLSDSNSNCYYTDEEFEWENKNKQNDDLISSLKEQIESLNKQLEAIGKEDLKLINDLSNKIENLAKMNHVCHWLSI